MAAELLKQVETFIASVEKVRELTREIGTYNDSKEFRKRLDDLREGTRDRERVISEKIEQIPPDALQASAKTDWMNLYKESHKAEQMCSLTDNSAPAIMDEEDEEEILSKLQLQQRKPFASKDEIAKEIVVERNREIQQLKGEMTQVAQLHTLTGQLLKTTGEKLDVIETNVDKAEADSNVAVYEIAQAATQQTESWPLSGAAFGGMVGGGLGLFVGPVGLALGSTAGATVGNMLGHSLAQAQKEQVDREIATHTLKEKWLPDEEAPFCQSCKTPFTTFFRRHHCRQCGGVFCATCSDKQLPFEFPGGQRMQRACRKCFFRLWQ